MPSLGIPPRLARSVRRALVGARRLSIPVWAKLSLFIVALLAATVALVSGFHLHRQQRTLEEEMEKFLFGGGSEKPKDYKPQA